MTKTNFLNCVEVVLKIEGGYNNDSDDSGGITNFGIAQNFNTDIDVSGLTKDDAREIYYNRYWRPCKCYELPSGIDLLIFDCAVNQGPDTAIRILQQALQVNVDGIIGPKTIKAANEAEHLWLVTEISARRGLHYSGLKNFKKFGLGWMRRLQDIAARSLLWYYLKEKETKK